MPADGVLPLLAGLVSAAFAALVWRQYARGRAAHALAWAFGLTAYAGASLADAVVAWRGWSVPLYVAYLALASGNVGLLGAGTIYLLRAGRWGHAFAALVGVGIAVILVGSAFVAIDAPRLAAEGTGAGLDAVPKEGAGGAVRVAFILESALGGVALIGGAFWSFAQTRRPGVLLIAVGALLIATGGTIQGVVSRYATEASGLGLAARLATQLVGVAVMLAGYLQGRRAIARARTAASEA